MVKKEKLDDSTVEMLRDMGDVGDLMNPTKLMDPIKNIEEKWALVPAFLKFHGLVRQHIDSYDHFVNVGMQEIVAANDLVETEGDAHFFLKYKKAWIGEPRLEEQLNVFDNLKPMHCRLRDLTYSAPIYVDVEYVRGKNVVVRNGLMIGRMPIMLKSSKCVLLGLSEDALVMAGECSLDPGGYFIVKGTEKVILIQEQLSKNRIIIETDSKGCLAASVTSSAHHFKSRCQVVLGKDGVLTVRHNNFAEDINAIVMLRALGVPSEAAAAIMVGSELVDDLTPTLQNAAVFRARTELEALDSIGARMRQPTYWRARRSRADEARAALARVVLGHVSAPHFDLREKAAYVALMMRRVLLAAKGDGAVDDRDYYGNKRLERAGELLALLFEDLFKTFNSNLKRHIDKSIEQRDRATQFDAAKLIRPDMITNGLANAISTGNWNVKRFKMERAGVTAVLSRLSFISTLGMMTRITSQFEKTRKITGPRALQPSQAFLLCPSDTPEGSSCGLVKNLAMLAHVTIEIDEVPLKRVSFNLGVVPLLMAGAGGTSSPDAHLVLLNGNVIGIHNHAARFCRGFRRLRRAGMIGAFVSVFIDVPQRAVHIASDGGRLCRPVLVCSRGKPLLTDEHVAAIKAGTMLFPDLLSRGIVEFIDVNEENDCRIAMRENELVRESTHLEIEPFTLLGVVAGLIPYPHHNQSPRNTYQCAMGKQAMGSIATNQQKRIDTVLYLLNYPQKPMVRSHTIELVRFEELPAGQNASIAVMSYSGYDIEDAVVINRASLDRGFGRCHVMRKLVGSARKYPNQTQERFQYPDSAVAHDNLDRDGIAMTGTKLEPGDMAWNKKVPLNVTETIQDLDNVAYTDQSQKHGGPQRAIVDQVAVTSSEDDHWLVKMLLRDTRRPELGDKFSSRHGQKGVVGLIANARDMPFSDAGIVPDIIMNPHGFPSRMTVGKMIELVAGKAGALEGNLKYGTAFGGHSAEECGRELIKNGYSYNGKDLLTSGITGETLLHYVFAGPVYYQKLKHMVMDKIHGRSFGPRAVLTRQPTEGRSRGGGLRLGEMERDSVLAYGASMLLVERLMLSSDKFDVWACQSCGLMGSAHWCQYCKSSVDITKIVLPYACKLLFQELQSMNVLPKLRLKPVHD